MSHLYCDNLQIGFSVCATLPSLANKTSGSHNKSLWLRCFLSGRTEGGQETAPMAAFTTHKVSLGCILLKLPPQSNSRVYSTILSVFWNGCFELSDPEALIQISRCFSLFLYLLIYISVKRLHAVLVAIINDGHWFYPGLNEMSRDAHWRKLDEQRKRSP